MQEEARELSRLAGRVLLGQTSASHCTEAEQHALLDLLVRGKLPLFATERAEPTAPSRLRFPSLASPRLEQRLARERARCEAQRAAFLAAQAELARVGIPLVLFKTTGSYPYTSSNVDALVPAGALERAARQLEADGFVEMPHYWEPNKRLLRRFRGARCELVLHLHEKISWLVLAFSDMNALWSGVRSGSDPGLRLPAPEHVVAALLAHSVYESSRIHIGDVWTVHTALAGPGFDWSEVVRVARLRSWLPGLALARAAYAEAERLLLGRSRLDAEECRRGLADPPPSSLAWLASARWPLALSRWTGKRYFLRKLLLDSPRSPRDKARDLAGLWQQLAWGRLGLRHRPASLICLCGIDGAGKSTQARALRAAFAECELPVRSVWMRAGHSRVLEALKRLLRRSVPQLPGSGDAEGKLRVYRHAAGRRAWGLLVVLEQVVHAFLVVRLPLWAGRSLVAERYVPDSIADLAERFGDPEFAFGVSARLLRALTPRPDLILYLDVSGEVAHARKPEHVDASTLEERRGHYRAALALCSHVEICDASQAAEPLGELLVDRALRRAFARMSNSVLARQSRQGWE